jgi:hypothetical protein
MQSPSTAEESALRAAAPDSAALVAFMARVHSDLAEAVRTAIQNAAAELAAWTPQAIVPAERALVAPAMALLHGHREALVTAICVAIHQRLEKRPEPERGAADAALPLTLIDETQIDEDIEIARVVQAIDSACEAELRHLTALVCSLQGLRSVDPQATPLPPLACAGGLRDGLLKLVPDSALRLLLLRHLGSALGKVLRRVFVALSDGLSLQGVRPAQFRLRLTPAAKGVAPPPGARAPEVEVEVENMATASASLLRLLERARQALPHTDEPTALRLFSEPLPAGAAGPTLAPSAAVHLMERLLAQIEQLLGGTSGARAILAPLYAPARSLAASDSQVFSTPSHPWWQLLDLLMAAATVHDDGDDSSPGLVSRSLGLVVRRMSETRPLDLAACQTAADGIRRAVTRSLDDRHAELEARSRSIQAAVDHDEVEAELREQLVLQLSSMSVCPGLRQFLLGPWAQAMAHATLRDGANSSALDALAFIVDDLIRALSRPGRPVSAAQRAVLLRQVADGLAGAGLPAARVEAELADLESLLCQPPAARQEPSDEAADPISCDEAAALQASLPTVPILLSGTGFDSTLEAASHRSWLDLLQPGSYCRLFLMGRWMTTQLTWVSTTHNLFVFAGRRHGQTHSLTRRMLTKLRNAGLAASIEDGFLLAQAMDTLTEVEIGGG